MGKTLSILALIANTLDDGNEWAQQQNNSAEEKEALKHSRSTLVVVPSARTRSFLSQQKEPPKTDLTSPHLQQLDGRNTNV